MEAKKEYIVTGLMSGTSLDGLDMACCRFYHTNDAGWQYEILAADCITYDAYWQNALQTACTLGGLALMRLHSAYGSYVAGLVLAFHQQHRLSPLAVASHGHTVFHEPHNRLSFQLGCGAALHAGCGLPVVSNFRALDVALGGQGAPLVPLGDKLLFARYAACLNLGGIANISFDNIKGERAAYDISPCNLLLNHIAMQAGQAYDAGGQMAKQGRADDALLARLDAWPYYAKPYPRSLDKDTLLAELLPVLDNSPLPPQDKLATLSLHTGRQIGKALDAIPVAGSKKGRVLATGGGAFNTQLIADIGAHSQWEVIVPDKETIAYKEALIFAFLGLLRLLGQPNTLASATGASHSSMGGELWGMGLLGGH